MEYKSLERRKFKRLSVNFIVTFQVDRPPEVRMSVGGYDVDALMMDLSEGGMAITTDYEIPNGTQLFINFTLINPYVCEDERVSKLELVGEVRNIAHVNQRQFRLGIFFINLNDKNKKAISDFIRLEDQK